MECYSIAEHFDSLVPICTPGWRRVHFSCLSAPLVDTILLRVTFVRKQTCSNPSFSYSAERAAKKRGRKKGWKTVVAFLFSHALPFLSCSRAFSRVTLDKLGDRGPLSVFFTRRVKAKTQTYNHPRFSCFSQLQVQLNQTDRKTLDWFTAVGDTFWCGEVYKRVGISQVEVHKRVGKSVI